MEWIIPASLIAIGSSSISRNNCPAQSFGRKPCLYWGAD